MILNIHTPLLTEENFQLYAALNYRNKQCSSMDEWNEDIRRIKYIKKLCTRFETTGELKTRLILNHFVVLGNVFLPEPLCRIMFLKMEPQFSLIKPFLMTLNFLVDEIVNVKELQIVKTDRIAMNQEIINSLREILPGKRLD